MAAGVKKRTKANIKIKLALAAAGILLCVGGTLIFLYISGRPEEHMLMEAGEAIPDAADFFDGICIGADYSDISQVKTDKAGIYNISLKNTLFSYESAIEVRDTISPRAVFKDNALLPVNEELSAWELIEEVDDATEVTARLEGSVDVGVFGKKEVTVILEDGGGNIISQKVAFYIVDPQVNDVTPPTAVLAEKTIYEGDTLPAESLIADITDESEVSVAYETEPDFSKAGDVNVRLVLTDIYNNSAVYDTRVRVIRDETPPVITGVADIYTYVNEKISVTSGISAWDERDGATEVNVDTSAVSFEKEGIYPVVYTATDSSGNTASISANVHVRPALNVEAKLDEKLNAVLDGIINEGMSEREKAKAVYDWTLNNIKYVGTSDKSSEQKAALDGLTSRRGDCYTYFALAKLMLNRLGIESIDIVRSPDSVRNTDHYWLAINLGDGWFQFDSSPRHKDYPFDGFMFTREQAEEYNEKQPGYYTIDESLYPELR